MMLAQIGALHAISAAEGVALHHVKPHGALYTVACTDRTVADAIAKAVACFNKNLRFVGLAGSELIKAGEAAGSVSPPTTYDVNYANMSFGQGVSVTMAQMVMSVAAIAKTLEFLAKVL